MGHIDSNIISKLENSSFILLESNYDPNILSYSKYPYSLKQRIAGPNGHLSNEAAGPLSESLSQLTMSQYQSVIQLKLDMIENNEPEEHLENEKHQRTTATIHFPFDDNWNESQMNVEK